MNQIVELPPERTVHIREHFPEPYSDLLSGIDLPYNLLRGAGFERLCCLLLIADNKVPRYFGKSGDTDYGVDLVVSDGHTCEVYQCKNVKEYKKGDLSEWLGKFEQDWLVERPKLPKPNKYVLICPLDHLEKDGVEEAKSEFFLRKEVPVEIWPKTILDQRLKGLPDIVADLFSDTIANSFCSLDVLGRRWEDGFTTPLAPRGRGAAAVERFFSLHDEKRFALDADIAERRDSLHDEGLLAFIGASGSGKTMAALGLASYAAKEGLRPWHVNMRTADPARLFESIERRAVRPSIFVLDDCHLSLDQTRQVLSRISTAPLNRRVRLILTVTTTADPEERDLDQGEISQFIDELIERQQRIKVRPSVETYRRIIAIARPDLVEAPTKTIERLLVVTAGNLFLLDEALRTADSQETDTTIALDTITVEMLQEEVMRRYFGQRWPSAQTIRKIAAVARFDCAVPKDAIAHPREEFRDRMLVSTGPPSAWLFTHSTLAELIFLALSVAEKDEDPDEFAISAIITLGLGEMVREGWADRLEQILRARLKLYDDGKLKWRLLHDDRIHNALHDADQRPALNIVSLACFLTTDADVPSPYLNLLSDRIEKILTGTDDISPLKAQAFGNILRTFRLSDANRFEALLGEASSEPLGFTLAASADLPAAMKILQYVTPDFANRLIEGFDADTLDTLVQRTIDEARSVGTINLALRDLGARDDAQNQLKTFEKKLGANRMTSLIRERADLPAAMKIVVHVTPGFANRLIEAFDADTLDILVERTIEEVRSVATIGIALRELGAHGDDQSLLKALEKKLGADRMIYLIRERADLPAAMRILQHVTPGFANRLIEAFDADTVDILVERTIEEVRSVATIGIALRQLGAHGDDQSLLKALEKKLGADRIIHLIRERADLHSAMKIVENGTSEFVDRLIEAFDADTLDTLVQNTINSEVPQIRHLPSCRRFFARLEEQLLPGTWWQLCSCCGDLLALSSILNAIGSTAQAALLTVLSEGKEGHWVAMLARTNAYGLSKFMSDTEPLLDSFSRETFEAVAVTGMNGIVERSTWIDLAIAHKSLSDLRRESSAKAAFLVHFKDKIGTVDLASPPALDDLAAAASLIQILWQERAQDRYAVANAIFKIAPDPRRWPIDHKRLIGGRLLLALAQSEEMPQSEAERLLNACAYLPDDINITSFDAKTLFLYLFNNWAALIARTPGDHRTLVTNQSEAFWSRLLDRIDTLVGQRNYDKKLDLLALIGLLEFTSVFSKEDLERRVRGVVTGFSNLLKGAEKKRGVLRYFAFCGLTMIGPPRIVNDSERIRRLLDAIDEYPVQSPALRFMRDHLSSRGGF